MAATPQLRIAELRMVLNAVSSLLLMLVLLIVIETLL